MKLNQNAPALAAAPVSLRRHPEWIDSEIATLRSFRTGDGIHAQLFKVAKGLVPFYDDDEVFRFLSEATADCGRRVDRDIANAIRDCKRYAYKPAKSGPVTLIPAALRSAPKPVEVDSGLRQSIIDRVGVGLADLEALSPVTFESPEQEAVIDALFPGDPLLCIGRTKYRFETWKRSWWRGLLREQQFVVPNPMSARTGLTQAGKESAHSAANTGPRRYSVIEADSGTLDEQAALIWHLVTDKGLPLVMVLFSGGKSLHAWFQSSGVPEDQIQAVYRYAKQIGFDDATKRPDQFVRLPFGKNEKTGACQMVHYWAPEFAGKWEKGGAA